MICVSSVRMNSVLKDRKQEEVFKLYGNDVKIIIDEWMPDDRIAVRDMLGNTLLAIINIGKTLKEEEVRV